MGQEGTSPGTVGARGAGGGWSPPPRPRVWRTDDVAAGERFAYYREAICEAFMELAPERGDDAAFSADHPRLGPLIVATARTLNDQAECLTEPEAQALFDSLLRLTALAAAGDPPLARHEPALRPALLRALMAFVEARLDDPALSVATAAAHLGVSKRYVHRLCERTGRSFSDHVVDRRLERALAALTAPLPDDGRAPPTVAEIAYGCGFADLSHFNRRFKARFGATPREVRAG